jgi:hypothetical protein
MSKGSKLFTSGSAKATYSAAVEVPGVVRSVTPMIAATAAAIVLPHRFCRTPSPSVVNRMKSPL